MERLRERLQPGAWLLFVFLLAVTGMSITSGYHRLWAHRTYQAHWSVRLVYILFGTMALQHSVLVWASQHRTHHRHVDDVDRDPYSAQRGFWFSHIGWILRNYPSGVNDFTNAKDLERDPMVMFQHRCYVPLAVGPQLRRAARRSASPSAIRSARCCSGELLRLVVNHHLTFFINSLAHMWGSQPYTDENSARDNGALALITYGEGYHNFHHIFQNDYRNGVRWWQYDPSKWLISSLSWVGLASDLKRVPDMLIQRAELTMQFKGIERALERKRGATTSTSSGLKARVTEEAAAFRRALEEWACVRDEWVGDRKRRLLAEVGGGQLPLAAARDRAPTPHAAMASASHDEEPTRVRNDHARGLADARACLIGPEASAHPHRRRANP